VDDVLIKVEEFIFPVDFIMLEIKDVKSPENEIRLSLVDHSLLSLMLSLIIRMEK